MRLSAGSSEGHADARALVHAPVIDALNGIVVRAAVGFCVVAGLAAFPLLIRAHEVHGLVHLALPGAWLAYAIVTGATLLYRGPASDGDPWAGAGTVDPDLARFAQAVSTFMILGWLAAMGGVLVHHHLGSPTEIVWTVAVDVPLMVAVGGLAAFAWRASCRAALTRAENEAADRLRAYWSDVQGAPRGG